MNKQKFYVVWRGRVTGIFTSWAECEAQIKNFEGAAYKKFESLEEAQQAYQQGPPAIRVPIAGSQRPASKTKPAYKAGRPVVPSISVDAACSGNPGVMEYRGVWTETGEPIFHQGPFPEGTNNIGEFLAIVHALAMLKKHGQDYPIYTDSMTALAWMRHKKARTKLVRNARNAHLFEMLARAEQWLAQNSYTTQIHKWDTEHWGEIPADFGRK